MRSTAVQLVLILAFTAACGLYQPGRGVTPSLASSVGCAITEVRARAEALRETLPSGYTFTPEVGWDACELLAHVGAPSRIERQQNEYGRYMSWWYQTYLGAGVGYDTRLVSLAYQPSEFDARGVRTAKFRWAVTYVGW
jgi:hypothetical protein